MATIRYDTQGVRRQPLSPQLTQVYLQAAQAAGIDEIVVISGGQEASGLNRKGSHRHDHGNAGDIKLVKNGRVLDFTNPNDVPFFTKFSQAADKLGAQGQGAGVDYMGGDTIHVGFGSKAVWGAGGQGANAPAWLREALSAASPPGPGAGPGSELFRPPQFPPQMQVRGPNAGNPFFSRFGVTPGGMTIFGGQPERMNPFFTPEMRAM